MLDCYVSTKEERSSVLCYELRCYFPIQLRLCVMAYKILVQQFNDSLHRIAIITEVLHVGNNLIVAVKSIGVPLDLFLTSTLAYALSQKGFPGRKAVLVFILFTMLFNGGIVPLYLVVKQLGLTNSILSVVFTQAISTYNMILMLNYFSSLPVSLLESARLDGAGEWKILWRIVLPLSMPIIATMLLFYSVARWNEWYQAMLFIRSIDKSPLQTVLRRIIMDSMNTDLLQSGDLDAVRFSTAIKMSAVMVTMVPVMCIFPFLQKHFVKGVMIGAIK